MTIPDLGPAARAVAAVVPQVTDDQLAAPTPCTKFTVAHLLAHLDGLAEAFTGAAAKAPDQGSPPADGAALEPGWRERIPQRLDALAAAWRDPAAWEGTTSAGGLEMDGPTAAQVAVNEVIVHGWDLARSIGAPYEVADADVARARAFVELFSGPGSEEMRGTAFGPEVAPPYDATPLEALIALNGRDPRWAPRT